MHETAALGVNSASPSIWLSAQRVVAVGPLGTSEESQGFALVRVLSGKSGRSDQAKACGCAVPSWADLAAGRRDTEIVR